MPIFRNHPCPVCNTVRYRRTDESGYVCRNGHQMVGVRREEGDDDEGHSRFQQGVKKLKFEKVSKRFFGNAARDAYFRFFQHVLQFMCRSFIQDLGFPQEFEYIVRELWLVYVNKNVKLLATELEADDPMHAFGPNTQPIAAPSQLSQHLQQINHADQTPDHNNDDHRLEDLLQDTDEEVSDPSTPPSPLLSPQDTPDASTSNDPPLLSSLLVHQLRHRASRQLQSKLQTRRNQRAGWKTLEERRRSTRALFTSAEPRSNHVMVPTNAFPELSIHHVIFFCYLGCVSLGWPVLFGDLHRWCSSLRLPMLTTMRFLPRDTIDALPPGVFNAMWLLPRPHTLRRTASRYIRAFQVQTGALLPQLDPALLLYRFIKHFYLPVEMYFCAKTMYEDFLPPREVAGEKDLGSIQLRALVIVLFLVNACYVLDDTSSDPIFSDRSMPTPLPKAPWLACIRAHLDQWETQHQRKFLDAPEVDLGTILSFVKQGVTEERSNRGKRNARSLINSYLTRSAQDYAHGRAQEPPGNDFYLDIPVPNDLSFTQQDATHLVDKDCLRRYTVSRSHEPIDLYPQEYLLILKLACHLSSFSISSLHRHLQTYCGILHTFVRLDPEAFA
ncbi:hypothetical protein DM01DRAFT_1321694 [Hesseltinella vesiculosa]|uniref:RRN7-type domain-containing protein n=1 Tax=Hesseltinella vesiculosa TaxID=101127 RepID=A0A1X2GI51_9FUNG|nr:hypothetical protein DM01DRAFT_1321694 [Hesseltinella vesiculosa]